jgi:hypothetical protein
MPLDSKDNITLVTTRWRKTCIHGVNIQLHGFHFHSISNICFANISFNGYELINCWMLKHAFPRWYKNSYPSQVKYLCLHKYPFTLHYKPRRKTDHAAQFTLTFLFPILRAFHIICCSEMLIFSSSLLIYQLTLFNKETEILIHLKLWDFPSKMEIY